MFRGLNLPLVAALTGVAIAAMVAPSTAFADCGGGPSAQHVYSECVPGGSGGKKSKNPTTAPQATVSGRTANELKQTGKDHRLLATFARGRGQRALPSPTAASASLSSPSALGSAFDLGSGPLALLAVLAGTALLLLGGSGLRLWRARHRI